MDADKRISIRGTSETHRRMRLIAALKDITVGEALEQMTIEELERLRKRLLKDNEGLLTLEDAPPEQ